MRFFRIPGFTGIEAHRDDADRGSLRVVEGCLPHGTGGLRSGPVWKKIGYVDQYGLDDRNFVSAADDGNGNSIIFVSRHCEVHDMVMFSEDNTEFDSLNATYAVVKPVEGTFSRDSATISSIGNRLYAIGEGGEEAKYIGKGPVGSGADVYPDEQLYSQEWSRFPKCQYYARGPKATIFAAGNPDKPLTVYISEPAGLTSSFKDNPYSTEDVSDLYNAGRLSTVDILGSDASKITALSTRGDQVVVHTDRGAFLLYAPAPDQASTGYRVEQAPATNFSSAVNHKVVSGEGGTQTFWVGHDGQVYKDEAASRGSAELKSNSDQDQANWKSKGVWEHELPTDLSNSFSVFSAQTGDYLFFVGSEEYAGYKLNDKNIAPPVANTEATGVRELQNFHFRCQKNACRYYAPVGTENSKESIIYQWTEDSRELVAKVVNEDGEIVDDADIEYKWLDLITNFCCKRMPGPPDPARERWATCKECRDFSENCNNSGCCPEDYGLFDNEEDLEPVDTELLVNELEDAGAPEDIINSFKIGGITGSCHTDPYLRWAPSVSRGFEANGCTCEATTTGGFETYGACIGFLMASGDCTFDYEEDCGPCVGVPNGRFTSIDKCNAYIESKDECKTYNIENCSCVESDGGSYGTLDECESALQDEEDCWDKYKVSGCDCVLSHDGTYDTVDECVNYVRRNYPSCMGYNLSECECTEAVGGTYETEELCKQEAAKNSECRGYNLEFCTCEEDTSGSPDYSSEWQCEAAANQLSRCHTWDLDGCSCVRNDTGTGAYENQSLCLEDARASSECQFFTIENCECIQSDSGSIQGYSNCLDIVSDISGCGNYELTANCLCVEKTDGPYNSLAKCQQDQNNCTNYEITDCECVPAFPASDGKYSTIEKCQYALDTYHENVDCWPYSVNEETCECTADSQGSFADLSTCQDYVMTLESCKKYQISHCECVVDKAGWFDTLTECNARLDLVTGCQKHKIIDCNCVRQKADTADWANDDVFASKEECEWALVNLEDSPCETWDLIPAEPADGRPVCECIRNADGSGEFSTYDECQTAMEETTSCDRYTINGCECKKSPSGWITGLTQCEYEKELLSECKRYQISSDCVCEEAEDGSILGLHNCEKERIETCARFNIEDCECVENQETGTIVGLSNCNNEFSNEPYATDCGGWFRVGCECKHTYAGGDFENLTDCLLDVEQDSFCGDAPWALPLPDTRPGFVRDPSDNYESWIPNPEGSSTNSQSECYCTQNRLTGTFATRETCQEKLLEIRGPEELYDCFGCAGDVTYNSYGGRDIRCCCADCDVFAPENPCENCVQEIEVEGSDVYYCHVDGGYACYESTATSDWCTKCDTCTCGEDEFKQENWVRDCDPTKDPNDPEALSDCERCPQTGYALIVNEDTGGCACLEQAVVPGTADTFLNLEECLNARNEVCKMYRRDQSISCGCEETFDGTSVGDPAFETVEECEAYVNEEDEGCKWFNISDTCECVEDNENGTILGAARCEELLSFTPGCEDTWINSECECVLTEPVGNTEPPFKGLLNCQNSMADGYPDRCVKYSVNTTTCECEEDPDGPFFGLENCEDARILLPECQQHWISSDCTSCTSDNPFDGSLPFVNLTACDEALTAGNLPTRCQRWIDETCNGCTDQDPGDGSEAFASEELCLAAISSGNIPSRCSCDDTPNKYISDPIGDEGICWDFGDVDGSGDMSQCQCIENGYTIRTI